MFVDYLVLQANAEAGPFTRVRAQKLNQSWETLQAALDELGQQEWDLYTTIYGPTKERSGPGEHDGAGFILKRVLYAARESAQVSESVSMPEPSDF